MIKKIEKIKENIKINKKIVVFLVGLAIVGIVLGSFFTVILKDADKSLVKDYMSSFLENVQSGKFEYMKSYINECFNSLFFVGSIWILGISVIGVPIIVLMYFSKAFVLGFSLASFILNMKAKGCLLAFVYLIPHSVVLFIVYIVLMNYSITLSYKLATSFLKKKSIDFKGIMQKYIFILCISLGVCFVMHLYEIFIVPKLMQGLLQILK
ncbi:MAG: stage II sporulation protein M [Bacilli bacterium]|nr:stage II sporulation protein M [Bacilli bacterium]